ncbi:hypothetical protein BASA81_008439 [Batrachochytrium salamandrivorans]|nr:hypothetical protein BASA81_008439 [Batrachochytrium salamandrivorans]
MLHRYCLAGRRLSTTKHQLLESYAKSLGTIQEFFHSSQLNTSETSQALGEVGSMLQSYKQQPHLLTQDKLAELKQIMENCDTVFKLNLKLALEANRKRKDIEQCFELIKSVRQLLSFTSTSVVLSDLQEAEELMDSYYQSPGNLGKEEEENLKQISKDLTLLLEHLETEKFVRDQELVLTCRTKMNLVKQELIKRGLFEVEMEQAFAEAERDYLDQSNVNSKSVQDMIAGLDLICKQYGI